MKHITAILRFHVVRLSWLLIVLGCLQVPLTAIHAQSEERESFAVMTAVLDSLYKSQGDRPSVVVVGDSLTWRTSGVAFGGKLLVRHESSIDAATIVDFEAKTLRSAAFPVAFKYNRLARLTPRDHDAFETRSAQIQLTTPYRELVDMPFWMAFVERYPRAWGISYLSRVGFNKAGSEALIYVRHQCGGGCASAETILLRKFRRGWRIIERIDNGSREGMGIGSLRYLGPGAHFISDLKKRRDSARVAIADSISRDRAPRRIRGTIINRQTGGVISFAQIFVRPHRGSVRRVVADSRGRYEIRNPMLGGTMLELQCPGQQHRVGATLDAPGTYVFPAVDTIINMGPPNIEPCWPVRRVRAIESGELASDAYRESRYPSQAEAAVYAAVLKETGVVEHGEIPVVDATTRPWCGRFHECPRINVAHLVRAGLIDPATVRSFRAVANDSVRLNPATMRNLGASTLSNGEAIYLQQESNRSLMFADVNEQREFWSGLRAIYPHARNIFSFTRAGFNESGDQAIVSLRAKSEEGETVETMMLRKVDGNWRVVRRQMENEPLTGALVDGRCIPEQVGTPPTIGQLESIAGVYDFTLVSSAVDDRIFPWRMRFVRDTARNSGAMPAFQVLDEKTGARAIYREAGTYLKSGRVYFHNDSRIVQLDGFGYFLEIREVSAGRFFGQWSHYSFGIPIGRDGRAIPEPAGHFCAVLTRSR